MSTTTDSDKTTSTIGSLHLALWCAAGAVGVLAGKQILRDQLQTKTARGSFACNWNLLSPVITDIDEAIITADLNGGVTFMNKAAERLCEPAAGRAEKLRVDELFGVVDADTGKVVRNAFAPVFQNGETVTLANHKIVKSETAEEIPVIVRSAPLTDETGNRIGASIIIYDVAEGARAGRQLDESERLLRNLSEILDEGVIITKDGIIVEVNKKIVEMFGYQLSELKGKSVADFAAPSSRRVVENHLDKNSGEAYEAAGIHKNGSLLWMEIAGKSSVYRGQTVRISVLRDITKRKQSERLLLENARLAALNGDVGNALIQGGNLRSVLNRCAEALVAHLDVAFARVWTLSPGDDVLEMQASAGIYTHLDGFHSRIPVGELKVGLIADSRKPHLTNNVAEDPLISDKDWARREGIVAFAGYPLIVEERLIGVMCVFARHGLSGATLQAMASVSNAIAVGIERKHMEECQQSLAERLEGAREDERRQLSRRLHDDIGQQMAVASIKLQRIEKRLVELFPDENSVIADVVIAQELLHRSQRSLRQVAHILHPGVLEHFGLAEALRRFTTEIKASSKEQPTDIALDFPPDFPRLKLTVEIGIYRIVQEAVINAIKHARAKLVSLKLDIENDSIRISVRDDGQGFDLDKIGDGGIGLASMCERAEITGGKLSIDSRIGAGTEVVLQVPLLKDDLPE